jgi:predicted unusual protein kinase regulating ubiquinone biosynthesis (AarF/ABC1/UbiB family)
MNQFKIVARVLKIQKILVYYHLDDLIEDIPILRPLQWFFYLSPKRWLRNKSKESQAERIRQALETLGPLYVKFGQTLSTISLVTDKKTIAAVSRSVCLQSSHLNDSKPIFSGSSVPELLF